MEKTLERLCIVGGARLSVNSVYTIIRIFRNAHLVKQDTRWLIQAKKHDKISARADESNITVDEHDEFAWFVAC